MALKQTFYIASKFSNREQVRELAGFLHERHGMRWANDHDWTQFDADDWDLNHPQVGLLWAQDLAAAVSADLFIHIVVPGTSHGSHAELGARCGATKEAHVVLAGGADYVVYRHPCVRLYQSLDTLLGLLG